MKYILLDNMGINSKTKISRLKLEKGITVIPKGVYCYDCHGVCPYWGMRYKDVEMGYDERGNPRMVLENNEEYGYCHFLDKEDCILLWDQCKICGINEMGV